LDQFDYYCPGTLEEAFSLLRKFKNQARVMAGGTDLIVNMKLNNVKPRVVIDLKGIKGLNKINYSKRLGLRVGALTTLTQLHTSQAVRDNYPFLAQASGEVGSVQVRNRATLGGNLCNASPAADTAPPLMAMGASVRIRGPRKERVVPLEQFFTGPGKTSLNQGEILVGVEAPAMKPRSGGAYIKLGVRRAMEIALTGVAAVVTLNGKEGTVKEARIALGAVAPTVIMAHKAEELLRGAALDDEVLAEAGNAASMAARPISDVRCSAEYRKQMADVLTRRALKMAYQSAMSS
jgi:carbon-monoxide dehydrogenase medium subunit